MRRSIAGARSSKFNALAIAALTSMKPGSTRLQTDDMATIKLFIMAGQSNMVGRGDLQELPYELKQPNYQVLWYGSDGWRPLSPPTEPLPWSSDDLQLRFGMEVSLGRSLSESLYQSVALVKYAVDGTNLGEQWQPRNCALYCAMRDRVKMAIADLEDQGYEVEVAGFFWMQGESDALYRPWAIRYDRNLTRLFAQTRRDFGSDLPMVYGMVSGDPEQIPYLHTVRTAMQEFDQRNHRAIAVETEDYTKPDSIHWDTASTLKAGEEFASAWLELGEPQTSLPFTPQPQFVMGLIAFILLLMGVAVFSWFARQANRKAKA
ncbi:MAG: sialate O-acetylesterase [Leptolyngbyaceae cyanobacterium SM1_4_3]|nr:sialate O-acetylesterase [Leptolyngbyaceae cyanobacterium SM1_4_3]